MCRGCGGCAISSGMDGCEVSRRGGETFANSETGGPEMEAACDSFWKAHSWDRWFEKNGIACAQYSQN